MAGTAGDDGREDGAQPADDPAFEALLEHIRSARGFDFTGYKRASLHRRIDKRMAEVGVEGYDEYRDHLEVNPDEYVALFNTILINVTGFFRDPDAWESLREHVVPRILDHRKLSRQPIRIWSAACSSGQEAYSLAMTFAEEMGVDDYLARVKIYATDVDEEDLERARQATYTADEVEDVPEDMLERYFTREEEGRHRFRADLRRSIIFGVHNIAQDAPMSNLDLLACRNTLMYFNADLQARVLDRFHFALRPDGFLFLGRAETLLTYSDQFEPVDLTRRLFTKAPGSSGQRRRRPLAFDAGAPGGPEGDDRSQAVSVAFDRGPVPQVVLDHESHVVAANTAARATFDLRSGDIGRPLRDLDLSYRPVELRSLINRAREDDRTVTVEDVPFGADGDADQRFLEVDVTPLRGQDDGVYVGTSITFTDVTRQVHLESELRDAHAELDSAYDDLQSTNEELETTNEELQSTVEELETTNEELQSSNEELETMNEELQSSNAELGSMNRELQRRSEEADEANTYLRSILRGLRGAIVVVDRDLTVRLWSPTAHDLWGLTDDEAVGADLTELDIGLPVAELREPIRNCISEGSTYEVDEVRVHDRRGNHHVCSVRTTPLLGPDDRISGAILLMELTGDELTDDELTDDELTDDEITDEPQDS